MANNAGHFVAALGHFVTNDPKKHNQNLDLEGPEFALVFVSNELRVTSYALRLFFP